MTFGITCRSLASRRLPYSGIDNGCLLLFMALCLMQFEYKK